MNRKFPSLPNSLHVHITLLFNQSPRSPRKRLEPNPDRVVSPLLVDPATLGGRPFLLRVEKLDSMVFDLFFSLLRMLDRSEPIMEDISCNEFGSRKA